MVIQDLRGLKENKEIMDFQENLVRMVLLDHRWRVLITSEFLSYQAHIREFVGKWGVKEKQDC